MKTGRAPGLRIPSCRVRISETRAPVSISNRMAVKTLGHSSTPSSSIWLDGRCQDEPTLQIVRSRSRFVSLYFSTPLHGFEERWAKFPVLG